MTERVEEAHQTLHELRRPHRFLHPLGIQQWAFNQLKQQVEVPLVVVFVRKDDLLASVRAQPHSRTRKCTCVSKSAAWKVLSSICMLILSFTCSTCRWPRRTGSSTEFALRGHEVEAMRAL